MQCINASYRHKFKDVYHKKQLLNDGNVRRWCQKGRGAISGPSDNRDRDPAEVKFGFASAMPDDDHSAISAQDAKRLFADWKAAPAIVLAVSGGPIQSR